MAQTFEELISSDLDGLYSAAFCFTQSEHEAEELLQECAVRAFHEFRRSRPVSDFRVWMLELLVTTYLRRERRGGTDPLSETLDETEAAVVRDHPETERVAFPEPGTRAYESLGPWLDRTWAQLDPGDRLVLWLSVVERLRPARVARMLNLDEEQVSRRHYRARRALSAGALHQLANRRTGSAEA